MKLSVCVPKRLREPSSLSAALTTRPTQTRVRRTHSGAILKNKGQLHFQKKNPISLQKSSLHLSYPQPLSLLKVTDTERRGVSVIMYQG